MNEFMFKKEIDKIISQLDDCFQYSMEQNEKNTYIFFHTILKKTRVFKKHIFILNFQQLIYIMNVF